MNKKLIIAIVIVAVVVIAGVVVLLTNSSSTPGTAPGSSSGSVSVGSTTPAAPTPTGNTITIGTSQGSVTMNNFYNNSPEISPDQKTAVINQNNSYTIDYNSDDSSFSITLLSTPLSAARSAAEAAFLSSTGISQADACKLKVTVEVPVDIDPSDAGTNFGLSFCPGALQTP